MELPDGGGWGSVVQWLHFFVVLFTTKWQGQRLRDESSQKQQEPRVEVTIRGDVEGEINIRVQGKQK